MRQRPPRAKPIDTTARPLRTARDVRRVTPGDQLPQATNTVANKVPESPTRVGMIVSCSELASCGQRAARLPVPAAMVPATRRSSACSTRQNERRAIPGMDRPTGALRAIARAPGLPGFGPTLRMSPEARHGCDGTPGSSRTPPARCPRRRRRTGSSCRSQGETTARSCSPLRRGGRTSGGAAACRPTVCGHGEAKAHEGRGRACLPADMRARTPCPPLPRLVRRRTSRIPAVRRSSPCSPADTRRRAWIARQRGARNLRCVAKSASWRGHRHGAESATRGRARATDRSAAVTTASCPNVCGSAGRRHRTTITPAPEPLVASPPLTHRRHVTSTIAPR